MIEKLEITKPKRSHKSKKEQRRKTTTRIFEGGFVERSRKPLVQGDTVKSQLIRVDANFAAYLREQAKRTGQSITEITRTIYLDLSHVEAE